MNEKLDAGRRIAARLLPAESANVGSLATIDALLAEVTMAQAAFSLRPADHETLLAELKAAKQAALASRRNLRRAHAKILRIRADERMEDTDFGCTRVCLVRHEGEEVARTAKQG
jgi:hypothetical protein